MKAFFDEFKKFISRGNVMDLAVAVIMGSAFGKIVTSLVNDIIMPLVGILIGQTFSELSITLHGSKIPYGSFIQNVVDFLIISFCIFTFTKILNAFTEKKHKEKEEEKKEEAKDTKSDETKLLEEIRDLLKKEQKKTSSKK